MKSLDTETSHRSETVSSRSVTEAVNVGSGSLGSFMVQVGGDFSEFFVDFLRIRIVLEDTSERSTGIFVATTHEQPTRRFGKDEESSSENGSPLSFMKGNRFS